jgi:hypothetical protein
MPETHSPDRTFIPPFWVVKVLNGLQGLFYKLSKRFIPPAVWMTGHIENFWLSRGIVTVIELNIAEHIKNGHNSIEKLAEITGTHKDALFRLMRMLCAHEIFKLRKNGTYSLTPYSRVLLEDNNSVKYFILSHMGDLHYDLFAEMRNTVTTGINASEKLYGKDIFTHVSDTPEEHELFIKGMANTSRLFAPVMLSSYNFTSFRNIVDIGGGDGTLLASILQRYKNVSAVLFDSEHIVKRAAVNLESAGVRDRVEIVEGNFFGEVSAGADLYIMKNILHDWDDKDAVRILGNVNKAMPSGSKLIVVEAIIENDNKYSFGKMIDILMLVVTKEGRERTLDEFRLLFDRSGFRINRKISTVSPFSIIECIKK